MKTTIRNTFLFILLGLSAQLIHSQTYTMTRADNGDWSGTYMTGVFNGGTNITNFSVARTDGAVPLPGSASRWGNAMVCSPWEGVPSNYSTAPGDAPVAASLPDGATLMITNNRTTLIPADQVNLNIKFYDAGGGGYNNPGYPFACVDGSILPDTFLLSGERIVLKRVGSEIMAVEMDCLGEFGGPAVMGSPCDDGNDNTNDDAYNDACVCAGMAPIPTLSQWGIIILGLSLAIFGLLAFNQRKKLAPHISAQ